MNNKATEKERPAMGWRIALLVVGVVIFAQSFRLHMQADAASALERDGVTVIANVLSSRDGSYGGNPRRYLYFATIEFTPPNGTPVRREIQVTDDTFERLDGAGAGTLEVVYPVDAPGLVRDAAWVQRDQEERINAWPLRVLGLLVMLAAGLLIHRARRWGPSR